MGRRQKRAEHRDRDIDGGGGCGWEASSKKEVEGGCGGQCGLGGTGGRGVIHCPSRIHRLRRRKEERTLAVSVGEGVELVAVELMVAQAEDIGDVLDGGAPGMARLDLRERRYNSITPREGGR